MHAGWGDREEGWRGTTRGAEGKSWRHRNIQTVDPRTNLHQMSHRLAMHSFTNRWSMMTVHTCDSVLSPTGVWRNSPIPSDVIRQFTYMQRSQWLANHMSRIPFTRVLYFKLAGYPALLGPLPLYFSLPIRYSFLPSLPRITRLRPEYLQCNNRTG